MRDSRMILAAVMVSVLAAGTAYAAGAVIDPAAAAPEGGAFTYEFELAAGTAAEAEGLVPRSAEIDGTTYVLTAVSGTTEEEPETMEVRTDPFGPDEAGSHMPDESLEEGGVTWQLHSLDMLDHEAAPAGAPADGHEGPGDGITEEVPYTGILGDGEVPETLESDGRVLGLREVRTVKSYLAPGYTATVTVRNYDADVWSLNGTEIGRTDDLSAYAGEILAMLGLDASEGRVVSVEWDGDPYTDGGVTYRLAKAHLERRVRDVTAVYSEKGTGVPAETGAASDVTEGGGLKYFVATYRSTEKRFRVTAAYAALTGETQETAARPSETAVTEGDTAAGTWETAVTVPETAGETPAGGKGSGTSGLGTVLACIGGATLVLAGVVAVAAARNRRKYRKRW